jgi:hypothetical protein
MVTGLDLFRERFQGLENHYVVIGGAACDLLHEEANLRFRVTQDLDIVVLLEQSPIEFTRRIWSFVEDGGYKTGVYDSGRSRAYRFEGPVSADFPAQIELLSRKPIDVPDGSHLSPLPVDAYLRSLSVIVLDDSYYELIRQTKRALNGVPIVPAETLVALKAKAYLELERLRDEEQWVVRSGDIRKHRNDVFRLLRLLAPADRFEVEDAIRTDLRTFLDHFPIESAEWPDIVQAVGDPDLRPPVDLAAQLTENYGLGGR